LTELAEDGFQPTEARRALLYGPIGLHLGAEQPEEIALSILAEIEARFRGTDAQSLRLRPGPIHTRLA
jgi:xanthine/CO dehydrogenase XdhC/CoxF family maturation factor